MKESKKQCNWDKYEDEEGHETDCGRWFIFNHGGIADNNFKYCPYCGRKIKETDKRD